MRERIFTLLAALVCGGHFAHGAAAAPQAPQDWPAITSAIGKDAKAEERIARIVAGMSLRQKVGQMTQAEIRFATPGDVARYYLGSVLNGGGSWPGGNKRASAAEWVALADRYHEASMSTDMAVKVPVIWGTDAVHGHNNVLGATLFPHNIGLGAANDAALAREIGAATGKAVRATGIAWAFAPTLAVARDDRWGRTYESFSEDGERVRALGGAYVAGLQGVLGGEASVIASAKHFIGDGGTDRGVDQGVGTTTRADMVRIHGQGYYGALAAGVQTVMASFSSWNDTAGGFDYGKMHGSRELLTGVLKTRMGFDGFVVSDWNGIAQVPGCSAASCARAINAGIDMVMVPEDWKSFIANTVAQVQRGEIPMARIDDAVTRILRVKFRAGLFGRKPSQGAHAGDPSALQARSPARRAVRESLVLLKNDEAVLPLRRGRRILVVGKSADSLPNQAGGWSITWQGTGNDNGDFPQGDTILAGIREAAGAANVQFSERAIDVDPRRFDAVIAVIGETPYAESTGDIPASGTLQHSQRYPEDLAVLEAVAGKGTPVVTVLVSGRPVYANDLLNLSDAFVAAWLPGTEGKGVADMLFRNVAGGIDHDFRGTLPFSWPKAACQTPLNVGDAAYDPLFAFGYGLRYASPARVGTLAAAVSAGGCASASVVQVFRQSARPPFALYVSAAAGGWREIGVGDDLNATIETPAGQTAIRVSTAQVNTQQDARRVAWSGNARFYARSARASDFRPLAQAGGSLRFDVVVAQMPRGPVTISLGCGPGCAGTLDLTRALRAASPQSRVSIAIPLTCFAGRGADLGKVDIPFSIAADGEFDASFADIRITAGAANDADAVACREAGIASRWRELQIAMLESAASPELLRIPYPSELH